jgi:N-acetylmuramoyl-L-alanine amidase
MPVLNFALLFSFFLFFAPAPIHAAVELAIGERESVIIEEVYLREGVAFLPIDEVLQALQLSGSWDSVAHVYRIRTPRGTAVISPGSQFMRLGERYIPLGSPPRFIDGKLRVAEEFLSRHLPGLLNEPLYYRNLQPIVSNTAPASTLDRFFAFILRKKETVTEPVLRGLAIDPGHGGEDPGALGAGGLKEKDVTLEVARRLERLLKMRLDIPVFLTRSGDYAITSQQRVETAARPEVDVLLLLHAQASFSPQVHGPTLFVRTDAAGDGEQVDSLRLARHLAAAMGNAGLGHAVIRQAPLLPLGRGDLPTVLVELGYLSNSQDQALLGNAQGWDRYADALFAGLRAFADELKGL